ncbi:isocitrate/isopropylmalate dehydrogenase family protein [Acuticoccus kandeliae]|uniref:isocitrate/isopropylmalate dehydrogenase family protein n=1 Tax=Acuticoccus kandeliae TaxID=2073160 RepID=UPI001FE4C5DB|nr:isocitrate/isopropylmalate family dehydrogenase [Acuticoccus kandeliae]
MANALRIATLKGDGIGVDVTDAMIAVLAAVETRIGGFHLEFEEYAVGAGYYKETGKDISPEADKAVGELDAIYVGAIGMPNIRHPDGTEIAPHLRLRERFQLYAGVRPVKAYPNTPCRLADPRAAKIDLVVLRESTEGLFYSAATHNRPGLCTDEVVQDVLQITRPTSEKLHDFAFNLARRRKERGGLGKVTCVDKANVFRSMAFLRKIFFERAKNFPDIEAGTNYIDAQALDLIRKPWEFDVLVTENMFGDILSDLAGGLVGGMGMAACAEIGDEHGLFQPAHGTAPDIMGQDKANPLAAILSGGLMLDYLADRSGSQALRDGARLVEDAIELGFNTSRLRPMEFGGDMGTIAVTKELIAIISEPAVH